MVAARSRDRRTVCIFISRQTINIVVLIIIIIIIMIKSAVILSL